MCGGVIAKNFNTHSFCQRNSSFNTQKKSIWETSLRQRITCFSDSFLHCYVHIFRSSNILLCITGISTIRWYFLPLFIPNPLFFTERRRIYILVHVLVIALPVPHTTLGFIFRDIAVDDVGIGLVFVLIFPLCYYILCTTRDSGLLQFQNFISTRFAFLSIIWNCGILS